MTGITENNQIAVPEANLTTKWIGGATVPFAEDEEASGVYGYGHVDRSEFARAVSQFDAEASGRSTPHPDDVYLETDVVHGWALAFRPDDLPDSAWSWSYIDPSGGPVTQATPGAFPMTWVTR